MRFIRTKAVVAVVGLGLSMAACGDAGDDDEDTPEVAARRTRRPPRGRHPMKALAESRQDRRRREVRPARPWLQGRGLRRPEGLRRRGRQAARRRPRHRPEVDGVTWEETISDNREPFLEAGRVDLVLASYSITEERRASSGRPGPTWSPGQQVLVTADSDVKSIDDLKGKEVCSVTGSTSIERINEEGAKGVGFELLRVRRRSSTGRSRACPPTARSWPASPPRTRRAEGRRRPVPRGEHRRRLPKEDPEMCEWINGVLQDSFDDGSWAGPSRRHSGPSGVETPEIPALDPCT